MKLLQPVFNLKTSAIAISALLLAGCKIEITVPEGGYLVGANNNILCEAEEECVVDVNSRFSHKETYVAVPESGYQFTGWVKKQGGLCGGSNTPCAINTEGLQDNPDIAKVLESDTAFFLEPEFERVDITDLWRICHASYLGDVDFKAGDKIRLSNGARVKVDTFSRQFFTQSEDYILAYAPNGNGIMLSSEGRTDMSYVTVLDEPATCDEPQFHMVTQVRSRNIVIDGYQFSVPTQFFAPESSDCTGINVGDQVVLVEGAPGSYSCGDVRVLEIGTYRTCSLDCG